MKEFLSGLVYPDKNLDLVNAPDPPISVRDESHVTYAVELI